MQSYDVADVVCAVVLGDLEKVRKILDNRPCGSGTIHTFALEYALKMGHIHIADTIQLKDCWGSAVEWGVEDIGAMQNMLGTAARDGRIEVLEWLDSRVSIVKILQETNGAALAEAAKNNRVEVLDWLERRAIMGSCLRMRDGALHIIHEAMRLAVARMEIIVNNSAEAMEWLEKRGASLNGSADDDQNWRFYLRMQTKESLSVDDNQKDRMLEACALAGADRIWDRLVRAFPGQLSRVAAGQRQTLGEIILMKALRGHAAPCSAAFRLVCPHVTLTEILIVHDVVASRNEKCLAAIVASGKWDQAWLRRGLSEWDEKSCDWGMRRMFARLWREDYVAARRPEMWAELASSTVATAIAANKRAAQGARAEACWMIWMIPGAGAGEAAGEAQGQWRVMR